MCAKWISEECLTEARANGLKCATMSLAIASRDANRDICLELVRLFGEKPTMGDCGRALDQCVRAARKALKRADALRREVEKMEAAGYGKD